MWLRIACFIIVSYHSECLISSISVDIWKHPLRYSSYCLTFRSTKFISVIFNKFWFIYHKTKSVSIKDQLFLFKKINAVLRIVWNKYTIPMENGEALIAEVGGVHWMWYLHSFGLETFNSQGLHLLTYHISW